MKKLRMYAISTKEYRLYTKGKKYYIYDRTNNTFKLKNDTGSIEFVPKKYFTPVRRENTWIRN